MPRPKWESPDKKTLVSWMRKTRTITAPDGPYDSWVDKNGNNQQDPDEPVWEIFS